MLTYLNQYGFVSIVAFWITNLVILVKCFGNSVEDSNYNSTWLVSFIALFVPIYFYPQLIDKSLYQKSNVTKQRKLYRYQSLCALICYLPSLLACLIITNLPCNDYICYKYQKGGKHIKLNNFEFNTIVCLILTEGIISLILSWDPNFSTIVSRCYKCFTIGDKINVKLEGKEIYDKNTIRPIFGQGKDHKYSYREKRSVIKCAVLLFLSILPIICGTFSILLGQEKEMPAYIYTSATTFLNGTVVSKSLKFSHKYPMPGMLHTPDLKHWDSKEIVAATIKHLSSEKEIDIKRRYQNVEALIIYEETGEERPSSPLPYGLIDIFKKLKPLVIHVKHGFDQKLRDHKNGKVVISLDKDADMNGMFE